MTAHISKDPLHGVTLEMQVNALVARFGWVELGKRININCFKSDPSVKSSLTFLRRTPWARAEVEALYLDSLDGVASTKSDDSAVDPWANSRKNKS
ncbi:VF530 family DNA-binding protein [Pectobacterium versatile]|uniref:VF530 family protein n=1 Tax=Pectobacterium versatile TaxID=2488639 RepID=UPI001CCEFD39|nr:VF530 family protein [Pectobacterium versatile]